MIHHAIYYGAINGTITVLSEQNATAVTFCSTMNLCWNNGKVKNKMEKMTLPKLQRWIFYWLVFLIPSNLAKHWPQSWSYVNGILVDYLIPTVYLTDILVVALLVLWGIDVIKSKKSLSSRAEAKSDLAKSRDLLHSKNWKIPRLRFAPLGMTRWDILILSKLGISILY